MYRHQNRYTGILPVAPTSRLSDSEWDAGVGAFDLAGEFDYDKYRRGTAYT